MKKYVSHIALAIGSCALIGVYAAHISAAKSESSSIATQRQAPIQEPTPIQAPMIPASFADLAEALLPSVVNVSTTQKATVSQGIQGFQNLPQFPEGSPFEDFFEDFMERHNSFNNKIITQPLSSLGSGFVIDSKKGYIVTNNHVIKDAENIQVTFSNDVMLDAKLIGTDEKTDIAVLQVEITKDLYLTAVKLGDSDTLRVGDWTLAIGNPFGLGGSVTAGIVSARARDIHSGPYDDYIQTDASINRGNSGGPLFNLKGEVIGINTAIYSPTGGSVGIGFSIPSSLAKPVINQITQYGRTRRGWLGVRVQNISEDIAETLGLKDSKGALIASVNDVGPAKKAGILAGDVILKVGDHVIEEMRELPRLIAEYEIGGKAEITYWRDGKEHMIVVKLGELEKAEDEGLIESMSVSSSSTSSGMKIEEMGFTLDSLTDSLRSKYNLSERAKGVLITKIESLSEAHKKGLQEGEVIVEINQSPVSTPLEISKAIEKAKKDKRKSVLFLIDNKGNMRFAALKIGLEGE